MAKKLPELTPAEVKKIESAYEKMGYDIKRPSFNPFVFMDDLEKTRQFCGLVQGPEAVAKGGQERLGRYQARAEKFIRAWKQLEIPADLDVKNETYKDVSPKPKKETTMAVGAAKKAQEKEKLDGHPFDKHFTKRGIAYRICCLLHDKPISKDEILAKLVKEFPDRDESGLVTNISVELSQLQKRIGKRVKRTEDEKRGRLYSF